ANTVEKVLSLSDLRELGGARVAAIGEGTENALTKAGVAVNLVPARFVAEALAEDFPMAPACAIARSSTTPPSIMASTAASRQILLPRAAVARTALPDGLSAKGWDVHVVEAYRTGRPELDPGAREAAARAHAVTFTASSTVTGWLELLGRDALPPVVACIGPVTAATAREARIDVTVESAVHTIDGLVEALGSYAARTAPPACP
ncbi:MAG: uroporphyrinogen-III synthase, partial [Acidimicrobiales bacterium]